MKRSLIAAVAAFAAMSFSNAATAAPNNFSRADKNRDGALTRVEACAGRAPNVCRNFDRMDTNRDGIVTRSESRAFNDARRAKRAMRGLPPKP